MPAMPPSDEPRLPALRRFRFDPQDPALAREVDVDGNPVTELPASAGTPAEPSSARPRTTEPEGPKHAETRSAADELLESDRLLAELDGSAPRATTDRPSGDDSRRRARPPQDGTGPRTGAPTAARTESTPAVRPGPPRGAETGRERTERRRSAWPYVAAGLAAALVIGLAAWLVLRPADDPKGGDAQSDGSGSGISEWAAGMCAELADFRTAAMPLRAEVAKATATDAGGGTVDELQRQAAELLSTLGTDLQAVGIPSGSKDASTAHTTIISAVNAAAASAKSGGGSAVGTGAASAILSALDRPAAIFQETVADLPTGERAAVAADETCTLLL